MRTILDQCEDTYGMCIRQYVDAGILFLVFLMSGWSCFKTCRKREPQLRFQVVCLALNMVATLLMLCLQIVYEEYYNTHIIFMFIEFYSYYLLTYALVFLYVKGVFLPERNLDLTQNGGLLKGILAMMCFTCVGKQLNLAFGIGSVVILLLAIGVTVLSLVDVIVCTQLYWIPGLLLLLAEIPLYIVTLVFCSKTKKQIRKLEQKNDKAIPSTMHLFKEEDSYIKLKMLQTNLFQVAFTASIALHIIELVLYWFMANESICIQGTNLIEVRDGIQLSIMGVKNLKQIVPHLTILAILWVLPEKLNRQAPTSLYIVPKLINPKLESNFKIDSDDQQIHRKLIY